MRGLPLRTLAVLVAMAGTAFAQNRQVKGTLKYEETNGFRPIRYITVTLRIGNTTLGTAQTDSNGYFSKWLPSSWLVAKKQIRIDFTSVNYAAKVLMDLDWEDDWIWFKSEKTIVAGTTSIDLSRNVAKLQHSVYFNIMDVITYGRNYADANRGDIDDITQVDVEYPDTEWSNYGDEEITLSGPSLFGYGGNASDHGWQDELILHEYGHHLQHDISDTDGEARNHTACDAFGWDFSWDEGWPDYYARAVQTKYPTRVERTGADLEAMPSCPSPETEATTRACLWDLHDGPGGAAEPFDRFGGTATVRRRIFEIFDLEIDTGNPSNLIGFHNAWAGRSPSSHPEVDRILAAHGVYPHLLSDHMILDVQASPTTVKSGANLTLTIQGFSLNLITYTGVPRQVRITLTNLFSSYTLATYTFTNLSAVDYRTVTIPSTVPTGTYAISVVVDPDDRIPESNENNNGDSVFVDVQKMIVGGPLGPITTGTNAD